MMKFLIILTVFLVSSSLGEDASKNWEDWKDLSVAETKKKIESFGLKCDGKNMTVLEEGIQASKDCEKSFDQNLKKEDYEKMSQEEIEKLSLPYVVCQAEKLNFINKDGFIFEEQKDAIIDHIKKIFEKDQAAKIIEILTKCYMELSNDLKNHLHFSVEDTKDMKKFHDCYTPTIIEYCKFDFSKLPKN